SIYCWAGTNLTSPPRWRFSTTDIAGHHRAEQFPARAVEADHLHLLDRRKIARTGVDPDARQQHAQLEIFQIGRLPHDVLAREVVAALLEHLDQRLRLQIGDNRAHRGFVAARIISVHEG